MVTTPNGETPLEVSIYKSLLLSVIHWYIYRYIVIWKVLIVMVKVVGLEYHCALHIG